MRLGNTTLVSHGIFQDESDLRIHVCVQAARVYIFSTKKSQEVVRNGNYKEAPTYTGSIKTAEGALVPPDDIPGIQCVPIPRDLFIQANFSPFDSTHTKKEKSENLVRQMIARGLINLIVDTTINEDEGGQLLGSDILARLGEFQVKCDYKGGHKEYGGTGNLYLQTKECNPLRQY